MLSIVLNSESMLNVRNHASSFTGLFIGQENYNLNVNYIFWF
jgi:hypothetical protein